MTTIAERLQYALSIKKTTKGAIAKSIGAHPSTINNYIKNNVNNPNPIILEKIANFLNISPDWLILGHGKMEIQQIELLSKKDFKNLTLDDKLGLIYSLLIDLNKGQDVLGDSLISFLDID